MSLDNPNPIIQILYAEDDLVSGRLVRSIAETEGYGVKVVTTGQEFLKALGEDRPDLILLDLHLPDASGLDLLAKARFQLPEAPVIVVTASNLVEDVVKALKGGALDYLTKPVDIQRMIVSLANASKLARQQQDLVKLRTELKDTYKLEHMIGSSPAMEQVRDLIRQAAPSEATVLIAGESGTGKELVARALHYASPRLGRAFTSAVSRRRGKFEQANGGSIFLDEIGDMPLPTQAKMLRVLQERSFQRVGGEEKINVNVRVICATNHNLEEAVKKGLFRMDLFYRINLIVIDVPPLRSRKSDIPELARHFLAVASRTGKHLAQEISDSALTALCAHDWPGNVRELQNAIQRAVTVCNEKEIQPSHLPPAVLCVSQPAQPALRQNASLSNKGLIEAVEEFERGIITAALEKCEWNKTHAAMKLGVTRRILSYKMQNLGIDKPSPQ
jgi:DNA-binding NtrC family response regulator